MTQRLKGKGRYVARTSKWNGTPLMNQKKKKSTFIIFLIQKLTTYIYTHLNINAHITHT